MVLEMVNMKKRDMEFMTRNEGETVALAARFSQLCASGDVVALYGDLGAGKTRFVRGLAEGLGLEADEVSSPTFVLMHEYLSADAADSMMLVHIDAYRMAGAEELESIGWDEMVGGDERAVVVVEWADRVVGALPDDRIDVEIEHRDYDERVIRITPRGKRKSDRDWKGFLLMRTVDDVAEKKDVVKGGRCPICGKERGDDSEFFPFCSSRCRLVDLGNWLDGRYVMDREMTADDDDVDDFDVNER